MAPVQGTRTGTAAHGNAEAVEADAALEQKVDSENAAAETKATKKRKRRSLSKFMRWGKAEEQLLLKLVEDDGANDWDEKAKALGTGRSGNGLHQHWLIMQGKNDAATAGPAKEKPQGQAQEPALEDSDHLSPSCPAASSTSSSDIAGSTGGAPSSGTGEVAASTASAEVSAEDKISRPEHASSGNTSSPDFPQPKKQKRLASVDKFYELAASRLPKVGKTAPVHVPANRVIDPS